jgi:hypothetical protein
MRHQRVGVSIGLLDYATPPLIIWSVIPDSLY